MKAEELSKLLKSNMPLEWKNEEEDEFGILTKAKMIKNFLQSIQCCSADLKMFALYGEWGSGKTSLMKWLAKELKSTSRYKVIYFESWRHEKDDNIAMSLLDVICSQTVQGEHYQGKKLLWDTAGRILKACAKSVSFNLGILKVDPNTALTSLENDGKLEKSSFCEQVSTFKVEYRKLEDFILGTDNDSKIIVFVDDLDRCEPENVLNLLSAIKLFFTYGQRTIYFCGLDKDAVSKAVKIKYQDTIKADEYLEKVFDICFNMPQQFDLNKMVDHYFGDFFGKNKIAEFFKAIGFTNPRHVKKVLNKFVILKYFKENGLDKESIIPDISLSSESSTYRIMLVLLFIVLYEFYKDKFYELKSYDAKIHNYSIKQTLSGDKGLFTDIITNGYPATVMDMTFDEFVGLIFDMEDTQYLWYISLFTPPAKDKYFTANELIEEENMTDYLRQFKDINKDNSLLVGFCEFLWINKEMYLNERSDYKIWNLFAMAETIL